MTQRPIIITTGEPAGIGPDLCVLLERHAWPTPLVIAADPALMQQRAAELGHDIRIMQYKPGTWSANEPGTLTVLPIEGLSSTTSGALDSRNGGYVLNMLRRATKGCLSGEFAAMVTGPVNKASINDAGFPFSGHTEFLAELTGAAMPVMMLATTGLRVALATTHLPLKDVSAALTKDRLRAVLEILIHDLQTKMGLPKPRILVCGLNPHAGESGHLGHEEIDVISPVLAEFSQHSAELIGPLPADTLFTAKHLDHADAVLAMYHDQGLPVLKYKGFGNAVNITLGLPIIRTSVDHGTALDLAGTGRIDTGSMITAINTAIDMVNSQTAAPSKTQ